MRRAAAAACVVLGWQRPASPARGLITLIDFLKSTVRLRTANCVRIEFTRGPGVNLFVPAELVTG